jgi:hypothetical protein
VSLDGVVGIAGTIHERIRAGVRVRLLVLDPDGAAMAAFSRFSNVDPAVRRGKIVSNLLYLRSQFRSEPARRHCELRVIDSFLSAGCIGLDLDTPAAKLFVQHYLYRTSANAAPLFALTRAADERWFGVYRAQFEQLWTEARQPGQVVP